MQSTFSFDILLIVPAGQGSSSYRILHYNYNRDCLGAQFSIHIEQFSIFLFRKIRQNEQKAAEKIFLLRR
jgi:hypothetical protein